MACTVQENTLKSVCKKFLIKTLILLCSFLIHIVSILHHFGIHTEVRGEKSWSNQWPIFLWLFYLFDCFYYVYLLSILPQGYFQLGLLRFTIYGEKGRVVHINTSGVKRLRWWIRSREIYIYISEGSIFVPAYVEIINIVKKWGNKCFCFRERKLCYTTAISRGRGG